MNDFDDTTITDPLADSSSPATDAPVEPEGPLAEEAPGASIRDTLKAAMRGEPTADVIKAENAAGRTYDKATGRFVSTAAPQTAKVAPAQPIAAPTTDAKPAQAASTPAAGPPTSWSAEAKAAFTQLPPAVQQAVSRREHEVSEGFKQYQGFKQRLEGYDRVLAPYRQMFDGTPDDQALNNILTWFGHITGDPSKGIPDLAAYLGFDLSTVGYAAGETPPQSSTDPRVMSELQTLRSQVGDFQNWRAQQQSQAVQSRLSSWSAGKEHFETVRMDMGRLMQSGIVPMGDLDAAYAKAMALNGLSLTPKPTASAAPPVDPASRVRQARHAAVTPRAGSPNGAVPGTRPRTAGTVREDLREAFDSLRV